MSMKMRGPIPPPPPQKVIGAKKPTTDYDYDRASAAAFFAVSEASRILQKAINNRQQFTVDVQAGEAPGGQSLDGSFEIRISVKSEKTRG